MWTLCLQAVKDLAPSSKKGIAILSSIDAEFSKLVTDTDTDAAVPETLKGSIIVKVEDGKVQDIKVTVLRLKKLLANSDTLIRRAFALLGDSLSPKAVEIRDTYLTLFKLGADVYTPLNDIETDWTDAMCDAMQLKMDKFCDAFSEVANLTNYVLDLRNGVTTYFLKKCGNLARYQNQGLEYTVGSYRNHYMKRTNRKTGKNGAVKTILGKMYRDNFRIMGRSLTRVKSGPKKRTSAWKKFAGYRSRVTA